MNALVRRVPDIGEIFIEREGPFERRYRVTGYLKAWTPPKRDGEAFSDMLQGILDKSCREFDFGKGKTRVVSCYREEAEYVSGSGICGCIKPVEGLEIVGVVQWKKAQIDEARLRAMRRVGEVLF